jgi:hypothetical protein
MMQLYEGQTGEACGSSKKEAVSEIGGWEVREGWGSIVEKSTFTFFVFKGLINS